MVLCPKTARYTWAWCLLLAGAAALLCFAAVSRFFPLTPVWVNMAAMLLCAVFGIECARQAYVHKRTWPQTWLLVLSPLSLINIFGAPTLAIGISVTVVNLVLWWMARRLARQLTML